MNEIYLSLGTNLGSREKNLELALEKLSKEGVLVKEKSNIYETEPVLVEDQPMFLNMVIKAECECDPDKLLEVCKNIEKEMGRKKGKRYGPRIIDIDILFFNNLVLETDNLIIPHPRISERLFVLEPLNEIAPDMMHPVLGKSVWGLLDLNKRGIIN